MSGMDTTDAVVIGSGPNGLVAAIQLARKGWDVTVLERAPVAGGAVRTEALTVPGYLHDTYSAFYGLLHATPVFRELGLGERMRWAHFDTPVAVATDPRTAAFIHREVERTAKELPSPDGEAWASFTAWWNRIGVRFFETTLAPIPPVRTGLRFLRAAGIRGAIDTTRTMLAPIDALSQELFANEATRALFAAGVSHTDLSIDAPGSTPLGVFLAMLGQAHGFPVPVGGAGKLTDALVALLDEAGGTVRTGDAVVRVVVERGRAIAVETAGGSVVRARHAVIADTGPLALFRELVGEDRLPKRFLDGLRRFRYGTGVFKVDVALDGPAPWLVDGLGSTGVVHLTGTLDDMARASYEARRGALPARPMLIVGQQSVADPTRAPAGAQTLWIETHVPPHPRADGAGEHAVNGWPSAREPFLERALALLEEHAPGARERIAGIAVRTPDDLQAENPNLVGGDVNGGSAALDQQLIFRPVPGWFRYRTPIKGLYLCSASTHPGGGVHGMGGHNCARRVLRDSHRPTGIFRTASGARRTPRR